MADTTAESLAEFHETLAKSNIQPLWGQYDSVLPEFPTAPDLAMIWRWRELLPFVDKAARDVPMDMAERRVLMLVNPAFDGKPYTTTNLFAGIQILEPGETAPPHRHTPSAMRFIIEGGGGATIVDGVNCPMFPGDLILTPNWAWHEHHNDSDGRVVWLDALDLPLANDLGVLFSQKGKANEYPVKLSTLPDDAFATAGLVPDTDAERDAYSPMFRYPWTRTLEAFPKTPAHEDGSRRLRYTNPTTGGAVIDTLDSYAWELAKGQETRPARSSANAVFHVVGGEGVSHVGDETIEWKTHDTFTVPHWNWTTHKATSEDAHLFIVTDREVMRRLHLLREEVQG